MKWVLLVSLLVLIFSGCVPMALMMEPELLPAGSLKHAVGMDLLVGLKETVVAPWAFQYLGRFGLSENIEASFRAAIPSIFISTPAVALEGGAKFGVPALSNASILLSGGVFFGKKPSGIDDGEGIFAPYLRIAPMAGIKIQNWSVAAKIQFLIANEVGFIPGVSISNGRFYLDFNIPLVSGETMPDGGLFGIGFAF